MRQLKVRQDHTELDIDLAVSLVRNVRALELDDSKSFFSMTALFANYGDVRSK